MARILYVSAGYTTHDHRFLEVLAASPHEVWFLPCSEDRVPYERRPLPARVHPLPPLSRVPPPWRGVGWITPLRRFRGWVRTVRPDLVHAGPVYGGGFLAALTGCRPLLVVSWGSDVLVAPTRSRWLRWVTRRTLRAADLVLGDCDAVRRRVRELGRLPDDRIVCFPWGVDLGSFRPAASHLGLRRRLGWERAEIVINTRSFEPLHGTPVFVEAMRQVCSRRPNLRVVMLGDGSLRAEALRTIERHGLSERFHLPGQVPHPLLPEYFNEADLYVSTTYSDGTSVSLLEAMACGLPVIATEGYGNNEWVTSARNGWLVPAGEPSVFAGAVERALEDAPGRAAIRESNLALVRERADWSRNAQHLLTTYDRLLAGADNRSSDADLAYR